MEKTTAIEQLIKNTEELIENNQQLVKTNNEYFCLLEKLHER